MADIKEREPELHYLNNIKIEIEEAVAEEHTNIERKFNEENVIFLKEPIFLKDETVKCEKINVFSIKEEDYSESEPYYEQTSKPDLSDEECKEETKNNILKSECFQKSSELFEITFGKETSLFPSHERNDISADNIGPVHDTRCLQRDDPINKKSYLVKNVHSVNKEISSLNCHLCSYSCYEKANLTFHVQTVHKKENSYKCSECGRSFCKKNILVKHVMIVHRKLKPHKCSVCNFCTGNRSTLKNHIQSVHQKLKQFECGECNYKTWFKDCLRKHIRAVHQKLRPFKCNECDYSSFQKGNLFVHIKKMHVNKNPLKCKEDDGTLSEQFKPPDQLKLKPLKWNERDGSKMMSRDPVMLDAQPIRSKFNSFKCSECDYTCCVKGSLSLHFKVVHKNSNLLNTGLSHMGGK